MMWNVNKIGFKTGHPVCVKGTSLLHYGNIKMSEKLNKKLRQKIQIHLCIEETGGGGGGATRYHCKFGSQKISKCDTMAP